MSDQTDSHCRDAAAPLEAGSEELLSSQREELYREVFEDFPIAIFEEDWSALKRMVDDLRARGVTDLHRHFADSSEVVADFSNHIVTIDFNQAAVEHYRAKSKDVLRREIESASLIMSWDGYGDVIADLAEGRPFTGYESKDRTLDGGEIWVHQRIHIPDHAKDDWSRVVLTVEDITERKRAEEALRQSEKRFKDIANSSADYFWERDEKGRFAYISDRYQQETGIDPKQILGKTREEVNKERNLPPEYEKEFLKFSPYHRERKPYRDISIKVLLPGGRVRYWRVTGWPVFDEEGEFRGFRGVISDITDEVGALEALRESEARFRTLVENAPEAITMLDVDTGLYVDANPMAETLHGLPRDELIGKFGPADLSPEFQPDGRPSSEAARDYLSRALAGEFPKFEWMHLAPDGQETICEVSLARLPDPHRKLVRASISDITERKAAEAQRAELEAKLAQAQKLDAVGQLTAGVAHDFNNVLAVIMGNAELLKREIGEDNPLLATVVHAIERAANLTQRLLAFSRKQMLNPEIINANNLITNITGLLHRTLEEHIEIETVTAAGLWNCEVDSAQLETALVNLAINARDAMPDGGKLTIETANARLDDDYAAAQADVTPGQYVMLAVTDTGSGMPPEVREHVFEPFFTTKEVGKGSGLGLSMIYGFVKQSGGHVTIYSEEGEGTTIKLYLPRSAETEVAQRQPVTDEVPVARGETVLVVEDDPDLRTLTVTVLADLGYQVMEAAKGSAALEQLGSTSGVNLLLTDVVLPGGMNGRDLAAEAERCVPGINVLYMSGYTENAIDHHGRLDGDAELLQKPFSIADLARAVRKALDGSST